MVTGDNFLDVTSAVLRNVIAGTVFHLI